MKIGFVGDVNLGSSVRERYEKEGRHVPFEKVTEVLSSFDLTVGNLECCLVENQEGDGGNSKAFAVNPSMMKELQDCGFDALNLANNHMLDCGREALRTTIDSTRSFGMVHFGAGCNIGAAGEVGVVEKNGRRVAFIGACDRSAYFAGVRTAGVLPAKKKILGPLVREARRNADLVTVSLHADLEFVDTPAPWRIRLCRWLVEKGAHLVICHHPHVVQGVEMYEDGLIAYSLGNFVFPVHGNAYQENHPGTSTGLLLSVAVEFDDTDNPEFSWDAVPVQISESNRPYFMADEEARAFRRWHAELSAGLQSNGAVRRTWRRTCVREFRREVFSCYYLVRRREFRQAASRLRGMVTESENWPWLVGFFTFGYR